MQLLESLYHSLCIYISRSIKPTKPPVPTFMSSLLHHLTSLIALPSSLCYFEAKKLYFQYKNVKSCTNNVCMSEHKYLHICVWFGACSTIQFEYKLNYRKPYSIYRGVLQLKDFLPCSLSHIICYLFNFSGGPKQAESNIQFSNTKCLFFIQYPE